MQLFVFAELEEPQNTRVAQLGQGLRLTAETFDERRVARKLRPQDFQGYIRV